MRVGILGTAHIAGKNRRAIVAAGHVVAAIASRDLARAQAWAAESVASGDVPSLPTAYGSYEALLADESLDAVYVPLPCGLHVPWVLAAAAAKKHVLVEKPAATSVAELEVMVRACRAAGVAILDGTMFHFHERQAAMRSVFGDAASFGAIGRVTSSFSFRGDASFFESNIRTVPALEPFGCLGDLGQYCIRFGLWVYDWQLPASARAVAHRRNAAGVPLDVTATFVWPAGDANGGPRTLVVDCAFTQAFRQEACVVGTAARLEVDDFVISATHAACDFAVVHEPGLDAGHSVVQGRRSVVKCGGNQEAAMWRALAARAAPGGGGFSAEWATWTLSTQACLDAALASAAQGGAETAVLAPALLAELGVVA